MGSAPDDVSPGWIAASLDRSDRFAARIETRGAQSLAAHRAGIKTFILPRRNVKDLNDVPREIMKELHFVPVEHMDDVIAVALHAATLSKEEQEVIPACMKKVKTRKVITPKAITSQIGLNH